MRKPLILNGLKGFFVSGGRYPLGFVRTNRCTVAYSPHGVGIKKPTRQGSSFMAQPVGLCQLRRKVPLDLRKVVRHEYKCPLKTRDPAAVEMQFASRWYRAELQRLEVT